VPVVQASERHELLVDLGVVALGCLAGGLAFTWSTGIAAAAALLGVELVATGTGFTPLSAAGLLLVSELGYWSFELRTPIRDDPVVYYQRALAMGTLALAGGVLASLPLLAAQVPLAGGPLVTLLGASAAIALLALLVRRS
jgi:hypothetical protein